jgi:hypothetical protein
MQDMTTVVCDNHECRYMEDVFNSDIEKYVDKECPSCGQNLLTREDYEMFLSVYKIVLFVNRWFSWLTIFYRKSKGNTILVSGHDDSLTFKKIN